MPHADTNEGVIGARKRKEIVADIYTVSAKRRKPNDKENFNSHPKHSFVQRPASPKRTAKAGPNIFVKAEKASFQVPHEIISEDRPFEYLFSDTDQANFGTFAIMPFKDGLVPRQHLMQVPRPPPAFRAEKKTKVELVAKSTSQRLVAGERKDPFRLPAYKENFGVKYLYLNTIASGSYGCVAKVKVLGKENSFAAVKFIKKQDGVAKSYFKELEAFLCLLKSGQKGSFKSIVKFIDTFEYNDFYCITTELLGMTLHDAVRLPSKTMQWVLEVSFQVLRAVKRLSTAPTLNPDLTYECHLSSDLHHTKIIHSDIKLDNILCVSGTNLAKMIDCGCFIKDKGKTIPVTYGVGVMPHRAPEIVLRTGITPALDEYVVGTALTEIYTGKRLYRVAGEPELLNAMVSKNGLPSGRYAEEAAKSAPGYLRIVQGSTELVMCQSGAKRDITLKEHMKKTKLGQSKEVKDFTTLCESLLQWDPKLRPKAADLLEDPIFSKVRL